MRRVLLFALIMATVALAMREALRIALSAVASLAGHADFAD